MKKNFKINWRTVIAWFAFSMIIEEETVHGKYSYKEYTYKYKVRYIPAFILFLLLFIPSIFINGIKGVPELWRALFITKHDNGDRTSDLNFKMTRIFAYNRFA